MKLSIFALLLFAAWTQDFPRHGYLQPCENCGLNPVSLSLANAFATTDLTFSFRTTTELTSGCLEMRIPLDFTIPNNTAYMLDRRENWWRIQVPGLTYSAYNDYNFVISNVTNPKANNGYGPFSILTRSCCGCQVVDQSLNFHHLAITQAPALIKEFQVSVKAAAFPIPIDSEVTITIDVPINITAVDKFWVKLDPMWRLPSPLACSFTCQYAKNQVVEITEIQQEHQQGFQITIRSILSPYSVPKSTGHSTQIWLLSPPEDGSLDNYIVYANGITTNPVAFSTGLIHMSAPRVQQAIASSNLAKMDLVSEASVLFVDVSLYLSHDLAGEGHRVEIVMSTAWLEMPAKPDCACWPRESCYCGLNPDDRQLVTIYIVRSITKDTKITIRGLIEINSSPLAVKSAVSYDPTNCKIDECSACSDQVLQANSGLELLFQATDLTGRQQLSTVGQTGAMAQFIVMPSSADFLDGRVSQPVRVTLVLPIQFILPKDFQYVYFKKHSTNFHPISDYHIQALRPLTTSNERNWRLTVTISDYLPLYYGIFALLVPNVTLPNTASNAELAYEARVELEIDERTYIATDPVLIWPNTTVSATAKYYCISNLSSAPLEITITAPPGTALNGKQGSLQYFLELEFPVDSNYGFPVMLGTTLAAGDLFPAYFQSSHDKERPQNLRIAADKDKTTLTMELNTQHSRTWVVLKLAVGRKLGDKDVPITIRAYNQHRGSMYMKNLVFEQITLLKSFDSSHNSIVSSDKLRLQVSKLGNAGTLELSIAAESGLQSLILVFPPNTGLGSLSVESSLFRALYFPFQSFSTALLLEYSAGETLTEPLVLTLSGISYKPNLAGMFTILAAESTSKAATCPLSLQFNVSSDPHLASITCSVCADLFSPQKVRDKLQVDFNITNGVAEGTTLVAEFDPIWGLNYTKCGVSSHAPQSRCTLDVGERTISLLFLRDIRESPLILQISLQELRQPIVKASSVDKEIGNLFQKVEIRYSESRFSMETNASVVHACTLD